FDACPHCNRQKNIIGREAFKQYLDDTGRYVRCRPRSVADNQLTRARIQNISSLQPLNTSMTQGDACTINVGAGTPTWVINGETLVGEQHLKDLAEASGCPLPEGYKKAEDVGGFTNRSKAVTGGDR
ncbi:MAG: hypothetical protein SVU32_03890, partial [Candidatus Nanohaloarchaea archaeon]|nr:hypothetical protein [Candidatus Nanohaloarchaea archaeon]